MTLKDIAKQLTTAVQTVPNLVQILRDGLEQAETGEDVVVTQTLQSGTEIGSIKVGDDDAVKLYAPEGSDVKVFFDGTSPAIASGNINSGTVTHSSYEYTATEDCYFMITSGKSTSDTLEIKVEDKTIWSYGTGWSINEMTIPVLLKTGQTYKVSGLGAYCAYVVRKVK